MFLNHNTSILSICVIMYIISVCSANLKFASLDKTYHKGLEAYTGERWSECITHFEESLHLYKLYKSIVINCRLKCKKEIESRDLNMISELKVYENILNTKDCLNKCYDKEFEAVRLYSNVNDFVLYNMQAKKPYEYLHICYFQMYVLPKAASAVYTYLIVNPDDKDMKNNLEYYIQQPEVDVNEVIDLESEDYQVLFNIGRKAYKEKRWGETIAAMEGVITDYLLSEDSCRAECEQMPEQEQTGEFVITVANVIAALLQCRQQCQNKLRLLHYRSGVEFLSDILNHLQISYYNMDKFDDVAKTVASYLLLLPQDEDMLINKNIYSTLITPNQFVERSDIASYYNRDLYEKKLLHLFHYGNEANNNNTL